MNRRSIIASIGVALVYSAAAYAAPEATTQSAQDKSAEISNKQAYVPPPRGTTRNRVGGGTRGGVVDAVRLLVLAPDHTGRSSVEQPVVYWYVSRPIATRIELTLVDQAKIEPVLELKVNKPQRAGIQAFDLGAHNVRLTPGVEYQWSVAVVLDAKQRSQDILASGTMQFDPPAPELAAQVAAASARSRPGIYAGAGYWYDAIDALNRLIEAAPADRELADYRRELLTQIGLSEIADAEGVTLSPGGAH